MEEITGHYETPPPVVEINAIGDWLKKAHSQGLIRKVDFKAIAMSLLSALHGPAFLEDMLGHHPTGHSRRQYVSRVVDLYSHGLLLNSTAVANDGSHTQIERTNV